MRLTSSILSENLHRHMCFTNHLQQRKSSKGVLANWARRPAAATTTAAAALLLLTSKPGLAALKMEGMEAGQALHVIALLVRFHADNTLALGVGA
jgi:hypothetical protein